MAGRAERAFRALQRKRGLRARPQGLATPVSLHTTFAGSLQSAEGSAGPAAGGGDAFPETAAVPAGHRLAPFHETSKTFQKHFSATPADRGRPAPERDQRGRANGCRRAPAPRGTAFACQMKKFTLRGASIQGKYEMPFQTFPCEPCDFFHFLPPAGGLQSSPLGTPFACPALARKEGLPRLRAGTALLASQQDAPSVSTGRGGPRNTSSEEQ